jgi:2'-5' RNA ligase
VVSSSAYPGLERKPGGPDNWVERAKGLPKYIERIAKHLHYEKGFTISHAIATAVNTVKRWALGGTVTKNGTTKRITPKTQAQAAAAVAEWEAKRKLGQIHLSQDIWDAIDLAEPDISDTATMVALMLPKDVAGDIAVPGGTPAEDLHITLGFLGDVEDDEGYETLVALVKTCAEEYGHALSGSIGGIGAFPAGDQGTPWLALVDVPGIEDFRYHLVQALKGSDYPVNEEHGFTPHVTIAYDDQPEPLAKTPVSFSSVWVVRGNDQRTEIPLGAGDSATGAQPPQDARISPNVGARREAQVELSAMLERARAIKDPTQKARVRAAILDLAFPPEARKKAKAAHQTIPGTDSFPIRNVQDLKNAIQAFGRAKDKAAAKKHIIARARSLGATKMLPSSWKVDLANAIMDSLAIDLALTKDGRTSYKNQGKWKHGFVPVDDAAVKSKAKGSPIAEKRIRRIFGSSKAPSSVKLKGEGGGTATGTSPGRVGNPLIKDATASQRVNPKVKREVSRGRMSTANALKAWESIPESAKTIRNGKRYVVATFGGQKQLTEWVGPSAGSQVKADPADGKYASLTPADAAKFSTGQLRRLLAVPGQPENVKKVLNEALRAAMKKAPARRAVGVGGGR